MEKSKIEKRADNGVYTMKQIQKMITGFLPGSHVIEGFWNYKGGLKQKRLIDFSESLKRIFEEVLNIEGVLFRLIDTAGIRIQTDDVIEQLGVAKSLEKMNSADLVVYLFDAQTTSLEDILIVAQELTSTGIKHVLVANKIDSITPEKHAELQTVTSIVCIAAKNKLAIANRERA